MKTKTITGIYILMFAAAVIAVGGCKSKDSAEQSGQNEAPESFGVSKHFTLDLGNDVSMKLVLVPAGKFMMGSTQKELDDAAKITMPTFRGQVSFDISNEFPQHEVTISKPFYMGIYEVTGVQYQQIVGKNQRFVYDYPSDPAGNVTWNDAVEFCKKLSVKTGKKVRLPTEAEWEYACRAGSKTQFSFGDKYEDLCKFGNYCDVRNKPDLPWQDYEHNDGFSYCAPVGSFKPNDWGLYDMHGNVWEWCADWYDKYHYVTAAMNTDPQGPVSGTKRVIRGGCWSDFSLFCRSAYRSASVPYDKSGGVGFRVVVEASAGQAGLN